MHSKKLLVALVLMLLVFVPVSSQAATVIFDGPGSTNAIGIEDLFVIESFYNVTFLSTTASDLYGPDPNWEWDFDGTGAAEKALEAVNSALNGSAALTVGDDSSFYNIGYDLVPTTMKNIQTKEGVYIDTTPFTGWAKGQDGQNHPYELTVTYADFQVVPVPAAVWLLGSGLIGLLGLRRRLNN